MLRSLSALLVAVAVATAPSVRAQSTDAGAMPGEMVPVAAAQLEWADIQPPGFDPGMRIAAVHGDPAVAGEPYVLRLAFPDGYRFPPHYHPNAENVTVLSGTFLLGMGEMADEEGMTTYAEGDFLHIPATHPHFGGAMGETVIQLHGVGPFEILLVQQ